MIGVFLSVLGFSVLCLAAPTSTIPERREFPVDPTVNPCQDFYQYACNQVRAGFKLREDRSKHTFSFNDAYERLLEKKKNYFTQLSKIKPASPHEVELKNSYLSCMDIPARKTDEIQEVRRVKRFAGTLKTRQDFFKWVEGSYLSPDNSPLYWGPTSNLDKPEANDLTLGISYLTLPEKTYYKKVDVAEDFRKVLIQFFRDVVWKNPELQAQVIINF